MSRVKKSKRMTIAERAAKAWQAEIAKKMREEEERMKPHYAKLKEALKRILGVDVEVNSQEVVVEGETYRLSGNGISFCRSCQYCGDKLWSVPIHSLADLGCRMQSFATNTTGHVAGECRKHKLGRLYDIAVDRHRQTPPPQWTL